MKRQKYISQAMVLTQFASIRTVRIVFQLQQFVQLYLVVTAIKCMRNPQHISVPHLRYGRTPGLLHYRLVHIT